MAKITAIQWIGIIPFLILIGLLVGLWWFTGFKTVWFYILSLVILVAIYICTNLFFYNLFEYGEKSLPNDKETLHLEKEESLNWWMYTSGAGFTFLIGGLPQFSENSIMAIVGLIFLIVSNLIYNIFYYPRYRFLMRKRIVEIELAKISLKQNEI